jgi:tyrosyl-tRNA synthetase
VIAHNIPPCYNKAWGMKMNLVELIIVISSEVDVEKFLRYLKELEFRYNFGANLDEILYNLLGGIK